MEQVLDLVEEEVLDKIIFEIELDQLEQVLQEILDSDCMVFLMKYQDCMLIKEIVDIIGKIESVVKMKIKWVKVKVQEMRQVLFF